MSAKWMKAVNITSSLSNREKIRRKKRSITCFVDRARSGHFTQTDPIGIAGGLNTYGYAGGDPINFSDPFGLSPCCEVNPVKFLVGAANVYRGVTGLQFAGAATTTAAGAPVGAVAGFFAVANVSRGLVQMHEATNDPNGPSTRNLLGLLPAGQMYDDPGEATIFEYGSEKLREASGFFEDPKRSILKWAAELLAIERPDEENR